GRSGDAGRAGGVGPRAQASPRPLSIPAPRFVLPASASNQYRSDKEPSMSKPSIEQSKMGTEAIAFCIARTLIERDPSLKAPLRATPRKMWELLEEREDLGSAEHMDT